MTEEHERELSAANAKIKELEAERDCAISREVQEIA